MRRKCEPTWTYLDPETKEALQVACRTHVRSESNMVAYIVTAYLRAGYFLAHPRDEAAVLDYGRVRRAFPQPSV